MKKVFTRVMFLFLLFLFIPNGVEAKTQSMEMKKGFFSNLNDSLSDSGISKKKYKKKCKHYKYNRVRQYPDKYENKLTTVTGIIVNVEKRWTKYDMVIMNGKGEMYELLLSKLDADYSEYLEGNKIKAWGRLSGNVSYETKKKSVTIPSINVKYDKLWCLSK